MGKFKTAVLSLTVLRHMVVLSLTTTPTTLLDFRCKKKVMSENCKEGVPDINLTVSDVSLIVSDKL